MANERANNPATSSVVAWTSQGGHLQHGPEDEVPADGDEPPDPGFDLDSARNPFKRTVFPRIAEHSESLLTKALHQSDEENIKPSHHNSPTRRRSLNSNISLASTTDLTSDTGLTSSTRTNTPSPPPPMISLANLNGELFNTKQGVISSGSSRRQITPVHSRPTSTQPCGQNRDAAVEVLRKKRCISFACGPKPEAKKPSSQTQSVGSTPATEEKPPRKTCIKFACPAKPAPRTEPPQHEQKNLDLPPIETPTKHKAASPPTSRKYQSPSATRGRNQRSPAPQAVNQSPVAVRPSKYLTANANDLNTESSRFHEFASDEPLQEDWIRQNLPSTCARLTINDTLRKENEIRRLGKEAEEEALEEEEEEEEENDNNDDDDDDDDDEPDLENEEDVDLRNKLDEDEDTAEDEDGEGFVAKSGYSSDIASDGYNTDNETGFAESEDEDDGELQLWTSGTGLALRLSNDTLVCRRPSLTSEKSDSSSSEGLNMPRRIRERTRRIKFRPGTPELPDSTDFVCGTLDEDRVLENAYISCMAVKRREKLHPIPQDIDPSFPTSEPEDEEMMPHRRGHDSDEQLWIHGEPEDIHHTRDQDGEHRKKKSGHISPKRYRSPPPKARGRSPRRLFDRHSPRRLLSPPPPGRAPLMRSPPASLVQGGQYQNAQFKTLAFRPGLTHTKSLPRASALFPPHIKNQRRMSKPLEYGGHVRGAIDIVKGLEQKRQRRREKFKEKYLQKHTNKARKGQLPQQRPQPGKGAQRMREIGLLSAGKLDPDQYVLSV
ncbi:hypothetical protein E0Z10_g4346 [Xylaria hypoxylon]|uniref:Uncharacterized protein n=1 Tax=Xylaria hypoxylon TaxID=37992 RepID=A0A4Z0YKN8_9PEZI|nr:hypothetical protein E0Z10_g4346 [Xylaria hypoxylon]